MQQSTQHQRNNPHIYLPNNPHSINATINVFTYPDFGDQFEIAFSLSWTTFSTVGYGTVSPLGEADDCMYDTPSSFSTVGLKMVLMVDCHLEY